MKKHVIVFGLSIALIACKQDAKEPVIVEGTEIIEVEKEPTTPEETEIWEPKPKTVTRVAKSGIPSDAIVLFDGSNTDHWVHAKDSSEVQWNLNKDASMTVKDKSGDIQTKQKFGSMQLHIEWCSSPENKATNQNRGNSGVFLQKRYEVQVLDNNDNDTYVNGQVGAIYKQSIPLVKASAPTGDWNTYDIIFHQPEFNDAGLKIKSGTVTVLHNGILIQDHFVLEGTTEYIGWPKNVAHGKAPILLQDHKDNSQVSYRNIWVREL